MEISQIKESIDFTNDDSDKLIELYNEIEEYISYLKASILEVKDEN